MTDRPVRTLVIAFGGAAAVLALGAGTALLATPHAPVPALPAVAGGPVAPAAAARTAAPTAATVPPPRVLPLQANSPAPHTATSVVPSRAVVANRAASTPAPSLSATGPAGPPAAPPARLAPPPAPPAVPPAPVLRGPEGKPTATLYVTAAEVAAVKAQAAQQQAPTQTPQAPAVCVPQGGQPCWDAARGLWECPNEVTGAVAPCSPAELHTLQSGLPWYVKAQDCVVNAGCRFGTKYTG